MIFHGMKAKRRPVDDRRKVGRLSAAVITRRGGESGFTLIEIMIAMFILVTALLGIISTTVVVIKSNSFSKTMTTATTLARDRMEILKNTGYNNLAGGSDTLDSTYTRTWTVINNSPSTNMKSITVSVVWTWQGTSHTVNLQSIVARE
jgi:prepilin-type N-terminal cleavage/methylation domain-containing protein